MNVVMDAPLGARTPVKQQMAAKADGRTNRAPVLGFRANHSRADGLTRTSPPHFVATKPPNLRCSDGRRCWTYWKVRVTLKSAGLQSRPVVKDFGNGNGA